MCKSIICMNYVTGITELEEARLSFSLFLQTVGDDTRDDNSYLTSRIRKLCWMSHITHCQSWTLNLRLDTLRSAHLATGPWMEMVLHGICVIIGCGVEMVTQHPLQKRGWRFRSRHRGVVACLHLSFSQHTTVLWDNESMWLIHSMKSSNLGIIRQRVNMIYAMYLSFIYLLRDW